MAESLTPRECDIIITDLELANAYTRDLYRNLNDEVIKRASKQIQRDRQNIIAKLQLKAKANKGGPT